MRLTFGLLAAGLLATATSSAHAAIYTTSFSGAVTQQSGAGLTVGSTVAGSFDYSTDANRFLRFTIDGLTATPPYTSTVTISPAGISNPYEAVYTASTSITQGTGATNTAFTLDLLAYNNFTSATATGILTTPGLGAQLETLSNSFDGNYSEFSYYTGTQASVTRSFTVALNQNSLATLVPEPASLVLLAAPMLVLMRRRR